jgi:hypothetical protein
VRIQADACGTLEKETEFFQFISGSGAYDLINNVTSVNVDGLLIRSAWAAPAQALLDGLNAKYAPCPSGNIFIDPYKSPYNGVIPPNSMVIAFTDFNPMADALKANLKSPVNLCGKAKIFVIKSSVNNAAAVFANQSTCPFSCPKKINVTFGTCSRQYDFDPNKLDATTGAYLEIDNSGNTIYKVSDGCYPAFLVCDSIKFIAANLSPLTCNSVGHALPIMSNLFTGNARYFTQPGRKGISYPEGAVLFDSITLYANDFNSCDSAATSIEKAYNVRIIAGPQVDISMARSETACGYYILPKIIGNNLSGNQKYWSDSTGVKLPAFKEGDTIYSNSTLFAYDKNSGCSDFKKLTISFVQPPDIKNTGDTLVPCGKTFALPVITGKNLFSAGYHTAPNKAGNAPAFGTLITQASTIYLYDSIGHCIDQDSFKVILAPNIFLPKDTFRNDTFCSSFKLPAAAQGITLKYHDDLFNTYAPGDLITSTTRVYYDASIPGCTLPTDTMMLTQRKITINAITIPRQCSPVDTLPAITGGLNLTGNVAYYSDSLGKGKRYAPGDTVQALRPNFFFADRILYAYDEAQYHYEKCPSNSVKVTIPFFSVAEADPIGDVNLRCSQPFTTPQITPSVFANQFVYSAPNRQGTKYKPGDLISQSGTYYSVSERLTCFDEDTFKVTIAPSPSYSNNVSITGCDSIRLKTISGKDFKQDSTFYFDLPFGQGNKYVPNTFTGRVGKYYIFDKSQNCQVLDSITVQLNKTPDLVIQNRFTGCDSVQLPADAGFPDLRFYTQSNLQGQVLLPLSYAHNRGDLYAVSGIPGCYDEDTIQIDYLVTPTLIPMRDTTACNEIVLPKIKGINLTGTEHYHEFADAMGETYYGDGRYIINKSMTLYVWDSDQNKQCWDEDTFQITILPKPAIDSVPPVVACEAYSLPLPKGSNLTSPVYFDAPGGRGNRLNTGDTIKKSARLYMYQPSAFCPAEQAIDLTIKDSTTSRFTATPATVCPGTPIDLLHTGKKAAAVQYDWSISGPSTATFTNQANQQIKLDTGTFRITLQARANECFGPAVTQIVNVLPSLPAVKNLSCIEDSSKITFVWDPVAKATGYSVSVLQGPTGLMLPTSMVFTNLKLGERVSISVIPNAVLPCANGTGVSLTCRTRFCPPGSVKITPEAPFCSGDNPKEPAVFITGLTPADLIGSTKVWSGSGIVRDTFFPAIAGPGNHKIIFKLVTKDSCTFADTSIFIVGTGSAIILNDKAVECAPPSQRQFNIRMQITTPNTPFNVYYSFAGGRSAVFPSSAANFTLSASFGLIGDSITIDSIVDAKGCKMQITSMANTRTFKAVQFISIKDTILSSTCNFIAKTYQYKTKIRNVNGNDPLSILSGGGTVVDSIYTSPPIPFGTRHQANISHKNGCDTLSWDILIPCSCTPVRDTIRQTACESQTVVIRGKSYTINNASGTDSIPSAIPGTCDTIRFVTIRFIRDAFSFLRTSVCPDDIIRVGNTIFDKNNPAGIVRLPNAAQTGCDSLVDVLLDFKSPSIRTKRDTICAGDSVRIDGILFNANHFKDSVRFTNQAANGCDSIVFYQILVETVRATLATESAGCTASSGKSLVIRTITGGTGPYVYMLGNTAPAPIVTLPLRINQVPSDTFNLVIKSSSGCTSTDKITFVPLSGGLKLSLGKDRTIKLGDTVNLNILANFTIASFEWITQDYLTCTNCLNPIAQPLKSTTYILEAKDPNGCIARDTLHILVDPEISIFVPNILNVNGTLDQNHLLNIYPAPQVKSIQRFSIYDRWGTTIVDLKSPVLSTPMPIWDGTFKGTDVPAAVYVYKMIYETLDGTMKTKYGDITVVR